MKIRDLDPSTNVVGMVVDVPGKGHKQVRFWSGGVLWLLPPGVSSGEIEMTEMTKEEFLDLTIVPLTVEQVLQSKTKEQKREPRDLRQILKVFAHIADRYDSGNLDEWRPEWGPKDPSDVQLLGGRGGDELLTLLDCQEARRLFKELY